MNDMGAYHSNLLLAARYRRIIIHDVTNKVTMLSIFFIRGSMPPNLSFQHGGAWFFSHKNTHSIMHHVMQLLPRKQSTTNCQTNQLPSWKLSDWG